MMDENDERQKDELAAVSAIYGDDFTTEDPTANIYELRLSASDSNSKQEVIFQVTLPKSYPTLSPPIYELHAPWMKGQLRQEIYNSLEETYLDNIGEDIIFLWAEAIREILTNNSNHYHEETSSRSSPKSEHTDSNVLEVPCPEIFHGEPLIDRKSVFQAHVAEVKTKDEILKVKNKIMEDKKVANATHNIVAYRFINERGVVDHDCDDDGETAAGSRLLHLLSILKCDNVLVIVTRWYGGIHLGPDRFKHIKNVARATLEKNGFLKQRSAKK